MGHAAGPTWCSLMAIYGHLIYKVLDVYGQIFAVADKSE